MVRGVVRFSITKTCTKTQTQKNAHAHMPPHALLLLLRFYYRKILPRFALFPSSPVHSPKEGTPVRGHKSGVIRLRYRGAGDKGWVGHDERRRPSCCRRRVRYSKKATTDDGGLPCMMMMNYAIKTRPRRSFGKRPPAPRKPKGKPGRPGGHSWRMAKTPDYCTIHYHRHYEPSTTRPLARGPRVLAGHFRSLPLGSGLDGRLLLERRGRVCV